MNMEQGNGSQGRIISNSKSRRLRQGDPTVPHIRIILENPVGVNISIPAQKLAMAIVNSLQKVTIISLNVIHTLTKT